MSRVTKRARRFIDYFFPREVMGPVVLVFSTENVVDILFQKYAPFDSPLLGWGVILMLSLAFVAWWGAVDEDMEEFEEELEEDGLD